ncbi:MAG: S8 family serine peptidase [Planctomycetota bacterium]|jgi:subtilisin family serine protease
MSSRSSRAVVGPWLLALAVFLPASATIRAGEDGEPRPVFVLCRTQFLDGPDADPAFCEANAGRKRSDLRREGIERLKEIAAREQAEVIEALGSPSGVRPLWLVNGFVVQLSPAQEQQARALEAVRHTYPAGVMPAEDDPGEVSEVLRPRRRRRRFSTRGKEIPWNLEALHVPRVWKELGATGEGIVVAMYDMGVNYRHEDLEQNVWTNRGERPNNGRDDDHNGLVDDDYGFDFSRMKAEVIDRSAVQHGTFTSGLVCGDGTGGTVTGVAPRARFMPLVAAGGAYVACRAFQYALETGADVVNMSFSIPGLGDTRGLWRLMAEHATASGLILVSGAGNFQRQARIPVQIRIPEGIPCVICAGGVNRDLQVPGFVSRGPVEWASVKFYGDYPMPEGLVKPDVCAFPGPGLGLISAASKGYLPDDNTKQGNSLSAPHVTGTIALMLSVAPELTPWRVKEILEATALDLETEGKDPRTGAGLMDAFAAVQEAKEPSGESALTR